MTEPALNGRDHPNDDTLRAYATGELNRGEAEVLEQHLQCCSHCSRKVASLSISEDPLAAYHRWLQAIPDSESPDGQSDQTSNIQQAASTGASEREPLNRARMPVSPREANQVLSRLSGCEILGELGRGGMGIVYRARDTRTGLVVALKTLQGLDAASLYRFKQEFRSLADVHHPNLVTLYDMVSDGQQWYFTMELVDGVDFLSHVRPSSLVSAGALPASLFPRLRGALHQLAEGLMALHAAGRLHRDLKPRNVMVTSAGRVVILDFGLAAELSQQGIHRSTEQRVLGTVAYMSPEQAAAETVSCATDWYSVGVMLYEALTGRLPFTGSWLNILVAKQDSDPPSPASFLPTIPEDLNSLCMALLSREIESRCTGPEFLHRLGFDSVQPVAISKHSTAHATFVGREQQLQSLHTAFDEMRDGRTVVAHVCGRSGSGKSFLIRRFLDELALGAAVVLEGRCFEQESVPYKAFDNLVDSLARYLRRSQPSAVEAILPRGFQALVRVFPVLRQVESVEADLRRIPDAPDPQELRRRAFAALRELLARLSDRVPLVVVIDDLQWGDVDSAALLADVLRPPDAPSLLFVGSYRSEEVESSPFLREFLAAMKPLEGVLQQREVAVTDLAESVACDLALSLLASNDPQARTLAQAIARESRGNTFFIHELVQYAESGAQLSDAASESTRGNDLALERVLWGRIEKLPDESRRLLEVLAVAGQPLKQADALCAAQITSDVRSSLASLRAQRLIRTTMRDEGHEIELYHDRIRETIRGQLTSATRQAYHHTLAETLETSGCADSEFLAVHFIAAGQQQRAGQYYRRAAALAETTLAFDRAAKLLATALELLQLSPAEAGELRTRRGDALANAGRGREAAQEYQLAAQNASAALSLELKRKAATQLMISGHSDEGLAVFREVLARVGKSLPASRAMTLLSLIWRQAWIRFRGVGYRERRAEDVPENELNLVDVYWTACVGLTSTDTVMGAEFQSRYILAALKAGEPSRVACALAMQACLSSMSGQRQAARAAQLLAAATALAERVSNYHALGYAYLTGGAVSSWCMGDWPKTLEFSREADRILRDHCTGVTWETDFCHVLELNALHWQGRYKECALRIPELLQEAENRGNLFARTAVSQIAAMTPLAEDDPDRAQALVLHAIAGVPREGFQQQHFWCLYVQVQAALYSGQAREAKELIDMRWRLLDRSLLLHLETLLIFGLHLRARAMLAAGSAEAGGRGSRFDSTLLRSVNSDIRKLEKRAAPWGCALARSLQATVDYVTDDRTAAVRHLSEAASALDAVGMRLHAAACRRRQGQLLDGDEGRLLIADSDAWMASEMIRNPARMTAMLMPGFHD